MPETIVKLSLATLPALGHPLADGIFAGVTTTKTGKHCAIVLLAGKPDRRLHWDGAVTWATSLDGELPTRPVAALLYANVPAEFEKAWYWTAEVYEDDGSYAWGQHFGYGTQNDTLKSYEGRARAVRLIHLDA